MGWVGPEGTAAMTLDSGRLAVPDALSVTVTVKLNVPGVVGEPVSAPVAAFSVTPGGNAPVVTDHVYGGVPPLAASVPE